MWKPRKFWRILSRVQHKGVTGFGGQCAVLAFCVKRHLYPDAEVVGAFNEYLWGKGIPYGHVFLYKDGVYFDARRASSNIRDFIPLVDLDPSNELFGKMPKSEEAALRQSHSALIIRNLRTSNIPKLSTQFDWVCRTFVSALI